MSGPDQQRRLRAERALRDAAVRLDQARLSSDPAASFAPLAEVLVWIVVLDSWHEEAESNQYQTRRDAAAAGRTLRGHRYARNLLAHQTLVSDLVDVTPGMVFPMTFPMVFHEVRWRVLSQLPLPGRPDRRGHQAYADYLQGQLVRVTIPAVVGFLVQQPEMSPRSATRAPNVVTTPSAEGAARVKAG